MILTSGMTRWALLLEYDGSGYVGWQLQATGLSIQELLERAAARLNRGEPVASIVAGRTDAGVHAEGQVAHLNLPGIAVEAGYRSKTTFFTNFRKITGHTPQEWVRLQKENGLPPELA